MSELCLTDNEMNEADDEFDALGQEEEDDCAAVGTTLRPEVVDTPFSNCLLYTSDAADE